MTNRWRRLKRLERRSKRVVERELLGKLVRWRGEHMRTSQPIGIVTRIDPHYGPRRAGLWYATFERADVHPVATAVEVVR